MDIHELTEKLGFCSEAKFLIFQADSSYDHDALKPCWQKLYDGRQNEGIADLRTALAPDENGMKRLACMLHCSLYTYELYMKKKIPKDIFFATMDFLPRFVNASQTVNGRCTFTWDWWFYRQLSLQEFRLGAFEYEMIEANGEKTLSLHIPSKADLSQRSFSDSVSSARMFFTRFFPDYANAEIMCDSWLLSPPSANCCRRPPAFCDLPLIFSSKDGTKKAPPPSTGSFRKRISPLLNFQKTLLCKGLQRLIL